MSVVDVDVQETWPVTVIEFVEHWAVQVASSTSYAADLAIPLEADEEFREILAGHELRAYHATRLLDHEGEMIRSQGLRLLTVELVEERLRMAIRAGVISAQDAGQLLVDNVFARGLAANRQNQVCLLLSDHTLRNDTRALGKLLLLWGGEAMYKESHVVRPLLAQLGRPAVVTALLDVDERSGRHKFYPALTRYFVGALLGLKRSSADVFFKSPIAPGAIERVAQPGDDWYDQFLDLPRQ